MAIVNGTFFLIPLAQFITDVQKFTFLCIGFLTLDCIHLSGQMLFARVFKLFHVQQHVIHVNRDVLTSSFAISKFNFSSQIVSQTSINNK